MRCNIILFETTRGEKPVGEFIKSLSPPTVAKVIRTIELLEEFGPFLNMPHSKKLSTDIYELRIRGEEEIRILYCFKRGKAYLLHAFKKQSQRTPPKELAIAQKRIKDLTN